MGGAASRPDLEKPLSVPVTVISAVWRHQQDKEALLRGHMANLDRQTVAHERIYVFDEDDHPPAWLKGQVLTSREPLTLYQAWNVALSLVQTPFVMNLNLDDRLACDAIEVLLATINQDPEVFLVGGDWKITASEAETDVIDRAYPLDRLPHSVCWPPATDVEARLGSGDGLNTFSYGPGCLWRMTAHLRIPRFPYRFEDGTLMKVIGDAVWWHLLATYAEKKLARAPLVIGNYRTWPASQAEFRHSNKDNEAGRSGFSLL
jgi:hypothetical protein